MKARRYQLRKEAVSIVEQGHPWIFREQLSSAASIFADGDWLRLVDGTNRVAGHGIYEAEGAIAIRMLRTGPEHPDAKWLRTTLRAALAKRSDLAKTTDGIRLVHGESDGIPAVVVDRFADTLVIASYSAGADAIARYVARALVAESGGEHRAVIAESGEHRAVIAESGGDHRSVGAEPGGEHRSIVGEATHVLLRPARRRRGPPQSPRALRGSPPDIAHIAEHGLNFAVDLTGGHKTGTYLDLRGLRRALTEKIRSDSNFPAAEAENIRSDSNFLNFPGEKLRSDSNSLDLQGARVLNLFAYTGMLGRAAEAAGAAHITHVDVSERALEFARAHHVEDVAKQAFVAADVFDWLPALATGEQFDVVICDPPAMTSKKTQVPGVLAAYRKLYKAAEQHVKPGGLLVAACCTSRVERAEFKKTVRQSLPERFSLERDIPSEPDHPVGFPQADYLKILLWRAAS